MYPFYKKYERHLTTIAFIGGFVFDSLTLQRIDRWFEHFILILYLGFSAFAIIIYNSFDGERERTSRFGKTAGKVIWWFPVAIQFAFGAVFSGSLVFYSRSASLSVSWPFLTLLVAFAVGNEVVRSRYGRLAWQLYALFVATFLYSSFSMPIVLKSIDVFSFIASGFASVAIVGIVVHAIRWIEPERFRYSRAGIWAGIAVLYAGFNIFYFLNLIPPLPLSLREIGIYHSIARVPDGDYALSYERAPWYRFRTISPEFHTAEGTAAHAFSSVYAPVGFSLDIIHEWFYRGTDGRWISAGKISFPIVGGRGGGYRGYSSKTVFPGVWKVEVKTLQGATIGRTAFKVTDTSDFLPLETLAR